MRLAAPLSRSPHRGRRAAALVALWCHHDVPADTRHNGSGIDALIMVAANVLVGSFSMEANHIRP